MNEYEHQLLGLGIVCITLLFVGIIIMFNNLLSKQEVDKNFLTAYLQSIQQSLLEVSKDNEELEIKSIELQKQNVEMLVLLDEIKKETKHIPVRDEKTGKLKKNPQAGE